MKFFRILALVGALGLFYGCIDSLEVINKNNPDTERVLVTPDDIQALIAGSFRTFWRRNEHTYPAAALSAMADEASCSWGNWGMRDLSSEPRVGFENASSYNYPNVVKYPWFGSYSAISAVNDALVQIIGNEVEIGNNGADTPRAIAFGRLVQGLSYGFISCFFDKAFIVDETTDLELVATGDIVLEFAPYAEVNTAAIGYLNDAIDICNAEIAAGRTFSITWINGLDIDAEQLAKIAHSYAARYLANVARTPDERAAVNWETVKTHALAGVDADWGPIGDGYNLWYSDGRWASGEGGWQRADYKTIGQTDQGLGYGIWLAADVADRVEFKLDAKDRRITGENGDPESLGLYFHFDDDLSMRQDRGRYHESYYMDARNILYSSEESSIMVAMSDRELDFLVAEADYRAGRFGAAAEIVDKYGVLIGELDAAPTDEGTIIDGLNLFGWLKYNKRIETYYQGAGVAFFDDRGWGDLVKNTPIHFPVPAQELETLELATYTFGGAGGVDSAPKSKPGKRGRW